MIQISLPCLHPSFHNACPCYLKSRQDRSTVPFVLSLPSSKIKSLHLFCKNEATDPGLVTLEIKLLILNDTNLIVLALFVNTQYSLILSKFVLVFGWEDFIHKDGTGESG